MNTYEDGGETVHEVLTWRNPLQGSPQELDEALYFLSGSGLSLGPGSDVVVRVIRHPREAPCTGYCPKVA